MKTRGLPLLARILLLALLFTGCTSPEPDPTPIPPTATPEPPGPQPLTELLDRDYLGFSGGLFPNSSNTPPAAHQTEGLNRARAIQPLDENGRPSDSGKIVVLALGGANGAKAFCGDSSPCTANSLTGLADQLEDHNPAVVFANGAGARSDISDLSQADAQGFRGIRERILGGLGVTELQVQVAWLYVAPPAGAATSGLPAGNAGAYRLLTDLGNAVRAMRQNYPNLQQIYISSAVYTGHAPGGEPAAFESGFAVKWLVEAQHLQATGGDASALAAYTGDLTTAPWLTWGPYLWADGSSPRMDGLRWDAADFAGDGIALSPQGVEKAGRLLIDFFTTSPFSHSWFLTTPGEGPGSSPETPTAPPAESTPQGNEGTPAANPEVTAIPGSGGVCSLPPQDVPGSTASTPIPLIDMPLTPGANYYGYTGGLYPGGTNEMPAAHAQEGLERGLSVQPLDTAGSPADNGKIVVLSIGMSNTSQEFCGRTGDCFKNTFGGLAAVDPAVANGDIFFVNGARSGQAAADWLDPRSRNYTDIAGTLAENGLSVEQVQVIWLKVVNGTAASRPSLPDPEADALLLLDRLGQIVRILDALYPNLQQVFVSSRTYGGYTTQVNSPEPYAYESGFSMKWLIEAQIQQMETGQVDPCAGDLDYNGAAPWLAWSAYLWANGLEPRSDGLIWEPGNFQPDGTHMDGSGIAKVGQMLLDFFKNSPVTACWFTTDGVCALP